MTIRDMEQRSGVARASIRYYEREGLLRPSRGGNGYRDYSEDDLAQLERIRLLRSLDVPLERVREVQSGQRSLAGVLGETLAALEQQRRDNEAAQALCRRLLESGADYAALSSTHGRPGALEGSVWERLAWEEPPAPRERKEVSHLGKHIGKLIIKTLVVVLVLAVIAVAAVQLWAQQGDSADCLLAKPVIYLYPRRPTPVTVTLEGVDLACTYPAYEDGWRVLAQPNGTLTDGQGQEYSYLFWDGTAAVDFDFSQGFCVAGEDTAAFLQETLTHLGLTPRESNEFIVYWLPLMEGNAYNLIAFQKETYTDAARLTIDPAPDSLLRVFMAWRAVSEPVELPPQELGGFERRGFTVVEWGGCQVE